MYATGPGLVRHTGTGPTQSNPAIQPHVPGNAPPPNFEFEEFINYDPDGVLDPPTRGSVSIAERRAAAEGRFTFERLKMKRSLVDMRQDPPGG